MNEFKGKYRRYTLNIFQLYLLNLFIVWHIETHIDVVLIICGVPTSTPSFSNLSTAFTFLLLCYLRLAHIYLTLTPCVLIYPISIWSSVYLFLSTSPSLSPSISISFFCLLLYLFLIRSFFLRILILSPCTANFFINFFISRLVSHSMFLSLILISSVRNRLFFLCLAFAHTVYFFWILLTLCFSSIFFRNLSSSLSVSFTVSLLLSPYSTLSPPLCLSLSITTSFSLSLSLHVCENLWFSVSITFYLSLYF